MAKTRRVIRKIDTAGQHALDEQFWPVILALFLLSGFLMGTVAAYLPFGGRSWWQDARTWLFVIPVLTCIVIWGLRFVPSRVVRRILQISIVLCLLVHLGFLVVSLESPIFNRFFEPAKRTQANQPRRPRRVVNDYQPHQLDERLRSREQFTMPVETMTPDPVPEPVEQQQERPEQPQLPQPMPTPRTQREIQRNPIERNQPAETRPRQSEQASRLSRQLANTRPQESQPIATPTIASPTAQSSSLEARTDGLRQRSAELQSNQPQVSAESATISPNNPMVTRRTTETAPTIETSSSPALTRPLAQPAAAPRVDVRTGESAAVSRQTAAAELQPTRTTTRQQVTASPREVTAPDPSSYLQSPVAASSARREQPGPVEPQMAQSPTPVPNRQPRATSRPQPIAASTNVAVAGRSSDTGASGPEAASSTVTRADAIRRTGPSPNANPNTTAAAPAETTATRRTSSTTPSTSTAVAAAPRSQSVERSGPQSTAANAPAVSSPTESTAALSLGGGPTGLPRQMSVTSAAGTAAGPGSPASPAAAPSIAMASERATANPAEASAATGATTSNRIARAARNAEVATSTTLSDTPRAVTADAGAEQPQARPSRLAMTQSLGGIAGVGQSANLDRSPSTPGSPSTTASGAARRAEATQDTPAGPALAPSSTSIARRSLVGSDQPSSSLRANTESVGQAAGTDRPSELNATAGASLVQQSANATQSDVTAARGNVDIDLGPTRIADAGGFERASGGGQPQINVDNSSDSPARTRSGGSATSPIATTTVDIASASPQTTDPASGELAAGGTAMQRNEAASAGGATAQPTGDAVAGSDASSVGSIAASSTARADRSGDSPAIGESGTGSALEEEEERRRRLARAAARSGPVGSLAGTAVDVPSGVPASESSTESALTQSAAAAPLERQSSGDGAPSVGATDQLASGDVAARTEIVGESTAQRAEAADAIAGPAAPGGGTAAAQRTASGREFTTNTTADVMSIAGGPASSGSTDGADITAQGGTPSPTANGVVGRPVAGPVGAVAGEIPRDAAPQVGMDSVAGPAPRAVANATEGPAVGEGVVAAAPLARTGRTQFSASTTINATPGPPESPASVPVADSELTESAIGMGSTNRNRQTADALPVTVDAPNGVGGLGSELALDVGLSSRLASPESLDVQTTPSRFIRQDIGGAPESNTSAVFAADAFRSRSPGRTTSPMPGGGDRGGPQTEEAIELGLSYLARRQLPDGSWTLRSTTEPVQLGSDTAATALCVLAFQGAGYNHREYKYATRISAALDYLVKNQKPDGDLFIPADDLSNRSVWLYSHGIAAIALCEAYGMTQDPKLRDPAQRALDFIAATQDPKGGGWRYQPGVESDTSVTGWMMMALKSGELAGLKVARPTYDHIGRWLETAQGTANDRHLYRYNPYAPNTATQRHGRAPSSTMTAVGLLMRLYTGWRRDHPAMIAGANHLQKNLPSFGTDREPLRDTYYWYYGTQVMYHMGGTYWEQWNGNLHPLLIESQIQQGEMAGSWSPRSPVPDRWAPHAGRLYVTTMNLLSLEVTYRHLPLYIDTAR